MSALPAGESSENQFSEEPLPPPKLQREATFDPALSPPRRNDQRARYVVIDCLDHGSTREEIRQKLMAYGYSEVEADRFIENVQQEQHRTRDYDDEVRGNASFSLLSGGIACLLGVVVAVGCIVAASYNHEVVQNPLWLAGMFIAWPAILFGARWVFRGLSQWNHW